MSSEAQHYIPRFYLKHFSKKIRKAYRIACLDKLSRRQFTTNIINVAQETDFYEASTLENSGHVSAESYFAERESPWSAALSEVIEDPNSIESDDTRSTLLEFVASFMARTPDFRKTIQSIEASTQAKLPDVYIPEMSEAEIRDMQSESIPTKIPQYLSILEEMDFYLFKNSTGHSFWTSDHPLIKHNEVKDPYRGNLGLLSKGIQLYLPLCPTLVLGITDPSLIDTSTTLFEVDLPHIQFCNGGQVWFSVRYIYSRTQNFDLALTMLQENPQLGDPDRPRVV